jgi:DNA modification methylase
VSEWLNRCHFGDCLETLRRMPDGIVQTCVTSPPYFGLRDYGHAGQIGLEPTPDEYVGKLVEVFGEVRRVMRDDGTLWLNLGDTYAGSRCGPAGDEATGRHVVQTDTFIKSKRAGKRWGGGDVSVPGCKPKDLIGIPWMTAFALRADGWFLRQDIIWAKSNPMPETVEDRCTKSHEYIFLLSRSARYFYDHEAIKEPAARGAAGSSFVQGKTATHQLGRAGGGERIDSDDRNKRSVWTVSTKPYSGAHFATFPTDLIEPCILAGAPVGGVVLDPFFGSGTTGEVAQRLGRAFIGCELNPEYEPLQRERLRQTSLSLESA